MTQDELQANEAKQLKTMAVHTNRLVDEKIKVALSDQEKPEDFGDPVGYFRAGKKRVTYAKYKLGT